ncbi:hypothetical protein ACJX0J_013739, partial [Zea mays]
NSTNHQELQRLMTSFHQSKEPAQNGNISNPQKDIAHSYSDTFRFVAAYHFLYARASGSIDFSAEGPALVFSKKSENNTTSIISNFIFRHVFKIDFLISTAQGRDGTS